MSASEVVTTVVALSIVFVPILVVLALIFGSEDED